MSAQLVSIVIPAYNAEDTIDETLLSVRSQTHDALEIIVVDDGSRDRTASIVRGHCDVDARVRLVEQPNAGVAAARNAGWQTARSDLIAFVDADDLWAPTKIERQLEALRRAGQKVGLVYCWYAVIDGQGSVVGEPYRPSWRGDVVERFFVGNFVGNGSTALVRREALIEASGFDSRLQAAGAHGCEDVLFYFRVAEKYEFEVVEQPLVGYRYLPGNMSSDMPRMLRSWMLVVDEMLERHPEATASLWNGLRYYSIWLLEKALSQRQLSQAAFVLWPLLNRHPFVALRVMAVDLPPLAARLAKRLAGRLIRRERAAAGAHAATRFPIGELR